MTTIVFLLLSMLQTSGPLLSVAIRCDIDTEIPLTEIRVSVEEKREMSLTPLRRGGNGRVTIQELPDGDLHLIFYRDDEQLGKIEVKSARKGDFIRLKVRLVEGNAILLSENRVRGVSGAHTAGSTPEPIPEEPATTTVPSRSTTSTIAPSPNGVSRPSCPAPGESVTLRGKLTRIMDRDSFELHTGSGTYTVYIGAATEIHRGGRDLPRNELAEQQSLVVRGTVAAGPKDECSIGAKSVDVQR
jgi:hypothetical protein